jgi:predicted negative regulator of RcsB-dependent stress response
MMKEQNTNQKTKPTPASSLAPTASAPTDPHLEELKELAYRHGRTTLIAVVVFLAVAIPIFLTRYYRDSAKGKASSLLSSATQPGDLENIVREYPNTPTAPLAMLSLAHALYDRPDYAKAQKTYDDFLSRYAQHQLAPVAEMGRAHCLEGKGLLEDALRSFETFASAHKDHYLTSQALLAKARCLHQLGKTKEARFVLEDFVTANPKSQWKARAEEMIEDLNRKPAVSTPKMDALIPHTDTNTPMPSLFPALPPIGR